MNNISQKNVILQNTQCTDIPYKSAQVVDHYVGFDSINAIDVNNLAVQMLDNDLYIENALKNLSAASAGPKILDPSTIAIQPDGYKVYGDLKQMNTVKILQKVEIPLSATISKIKSGQVKMLHQFGDVLFASIGGTLLFTSDPSSGQWLELKNNRKTVDATFGLNVGFECLLAATDGIYQLSSFIGEGETSATYSLVKLNEEDFDARCIVVDDKLSSMFVGTDTGILSTKYNSNASLETMRGVLRFENLPLYNGKDFISADSMVDLALVKTNEKAVKSIALAASSTALYQQTRTNYLEGLQTIQLEGTSVKFISAKNFNRRMVFATTNGLFAESLTNKNELIRLFETEIGLNRIIKLEVVDGSNLLVATNSAIYKLNRGLDVCIKLIDLERDLENISRGESLLSFCAPNFSSNLILGVTNKQIFFVDLSRGEIYPQTVLQNTEFETYLRTVFPRNNGLNDIKDVLVASNYMVFSLGYGLASLKFSITPNSATQRITKFTETSFGKLIGNDKLIKFLTCDGVKIAILKTGFECLDGDTHNIFSGIFSSNIIDAVSISFDSDKKDHIAALSEDGNIYLVKFNHIGYEFTHVKTLTAPFGNGVVQIEELGPIIAARGTLSLSSVMKEKLFGDSFNPASMIKVEPGTFVLDDMVASENQLHLLDASGKISNFIDAEILSNLGYIGDPIRSMANLPSLSTQVLATNVGLSAYIAQRSTIESNKLQITGKWNQLTSGIGTNRVALVDKIGTINAKAYWIDDNRKMNGAWLVPTYDGDSPVIASLELSSQQIIHNEISFLDLASTIDTNTNRQIILAANSTTMYQVNSHYEYTFREIPGGSNKWTYLAGLGECNLNLPIDADVEGQLVFALGNSSNGIYGCIATYGSELNGFKQISAATSGNIKKILYGGYELAYLAGGQVYEIYNNTSTKSTIRCGKWHRVKKETDISGKVTITNITLSNITDIDRIHLRNEEISGNFVDSYVTLAACNKTIFKKRRCGYSEKDYSRHSLSVDYNGISSGTDVLSTFSEPILNLDHIHDGSGVINVLVSTRNNSTGNGSINIFQLQLSSDELNADDSAKLMSGSALKYSIKNLDCAYFLDSTRILYKTTDSKVYQIKVVRNSYGQITKFVTDSLGNVISTQYYSESIKVLLKAQTINDNQNLLFVHKNDTKGTLVNCTFDNVIGEIPPSVSICNIHVSENDTVYVMSNTGFRRFGIDTGATLTNIGIGGKGVSYANGLVFVVGNNGQLSCYPINDNSKIKNLGGNSLIRAYAQPINSDKINVIAYSGSKVYQKIVDTTNFDSTTTITSKDMVHDVSTSMTNLYNIPVDKYYLTFTEYVGDKSYTNNIFYDKVLSGKISPDEQIYIGQDGKIMYNNGECILISNGIDSSTTAVKFINDPSGELKSMILSSSSDLAPTGGLLNSKVLTYPGLSTLFEQDNCIDVICRNSGKSWFWKSSSNKWMYLDGTLERNLPTELNFKSSTNNSDGVEYLIADNGNMYSPTYLEQTGINTTNGLTLSTKTGDTITGLGTSNGGLILNMVTKSSSGIAELYTIKTESFDSSKKEISAFDASDIPIPTTVSGLWMVDENPSNGIYAKVADNVISANYGRWLCKSRYGTTIDPLKNVDLEVSSVFKGADETTWILAGNKATKFTGYGEINIFEIIPGSKKISESDNDRFSKICELSGQTTKVLLASEDGINSYDASTNTFGIIKATTSPINELALLDANNEARYVYTIDGKVLSSNNAKVWKLMFDLSSGVTTISDVLQWSTNQYLFGTPTGLYSTNYKYNMIDNIRSFTRSDALCMYNNLLSGTMSGECNDAIQNHLSTEHLSNSLITNINTNFLSVSFDDIDPTWQKMTILSDLTFAVKNDIIVDMQFGSYSDGDIVASISNFTTSGQFVELSTISYIMKRWMSGITEIFVNIPSTKTYYLNNLYGAADCRTLSSTVIQRKNLDDLVGTDQNQNGNLAAHATEIHLGITSSEYHIDNLLAVEINGQSLPLKIYKDDLANNGSNTRSVFKSYIEPSIVKSWNTTTTDDEENYLFKFACFGTDAQAIRLMFYDRNARTGTETFIITFDPNGGDGIQTKQKFILTKDEDGYPVIEQKQLKKNKFTNTSSGYDKIFAGWSRYPLQDNEIPEYQNIQVFPRSSQWSTLSSELMIAESSDTLKDKDGITLYAVWLTYQFSSNDTILVFNSDKSEFSINSVGVDESTNLKDKVIVNWGD